MSGRKAGVIITDGKSMLAGLPSGRTDTGNSWDIPKGYCHPGEDELDAALRELHEETGLSIEGEYTKMGVYKYKKGCTLTIFKVVVEKLPPLWSLVCTSMCVTRKLRIVPEIGKFAYIPMWNLPHYYFQSLVPILFDCMKEEYFSQTLDKIE